MINDNEHHQALQQQGGDGEASTPVATPTISTETPHIHENVRATLSPLPAPHAGRTSISDVSARSSNDANRKSWDVRRSMDAGRGFRRTSQEVRRPSHEVRRSFSNRGRQGDRTPGIVGGGGSGEGGSHSRQSPRAADSESAFDPGKLWLHEIHMRHTLTLYLYLYRYRVVCRHPIHGRERRLRFSNSRPLRRFPWTCQYASSQTRHTHQTLTGHGAIDSAKVRQPFKATPNTDWRA